MTLRVLLTGASGALGVPLLATLTDLDIEAHVTALSRNPKRNLPSSGNLDFVAIELGAPEAPELLRTLPPVDVVINAAACTRFKGAGPELVQTNINGTRQLLAWAESLPEKPRFIHFSTTCVAGCHLGRIAEAPLLEDNGFINDYGHSKWKAERLVLSSSLGAEIIRLATVVGSLRDGSIERPGAFHTALRWIHAGLLPIIPGNDTTRLDLLPTELVTEFVERLLGRPPRSGAIYHLSCGNHGILLRELIELATRIFSSRTDAWRHQQILPPVLASRAVFESFRDSVVKSRDFLFNQVLDSVNSFLPELLYPKAYETTQAEGVWGGPLPLPPRTDWIERVIDRAIDNTSGQTKASVR